MHANVNDPDHVDPILEEIWQIREEMAAEWSHDFDTMLRYYEERRRVQPIEGLIDSLPNSA